MTVGCDRTEHILQIEFQSGDAYQYLGVNEDTWEDLHSFDSIGSFFNRVDSSMKSQSDYLNN